MHRGVQALLAWLSDNAGHPGVRLEGPAEPSALAEVQDGVMSPLPTDLCLLLGRHNGGIVPSGQLLRAGGRGADSILGALDELATRLGSAPGDPDLPLPYFRSNDGAVLAFDRSAAPIADTWPVVDCPPEGAELRLIHRTFDGFCRLCLREWGAADFGQPFSLERYLAGGRRHVEVEPDVAAAHATVAHALRRSGMPEAALASYLQAARCVPPLPWCDWEALKLAVLMRKPRPALDAGRRLCARAPQTGWRTRGTAPRHVADVVAQLVTEVDPPEPVVRLLDQLAAQAQGPDASAVTALRRAAYCGEALPPSQPMRPTAVAPSADLAAFWEATERAYLEGRVRDDDLLLDPAYRPLSRHRPLAKLLELRRDF